jgi:hypothetical protein
VLDEDHGQPQLPARVEDVARHVLRLLEVHARHRLVEQQQLGLHRQCPAQLDALLDAEGQQPHGLAPVPGQLQEVHDLLHRRAVPDLLPSGPSEPQCPGREAAAHQVVPAEQEVVDERQLREQAQVLERPADPQLRHPNRPLAHQFVPVEPDRAGARPIDRGEAVEDRRLAGAVGADDGEELVPSDLERHVRQGGDPPEVERQVRHPQQG